MNNTIQDHFCGDLMSPTEGYNRSKVLKPAPAAKKSASVHYKQYTKAGNRIVIPDLPVSAPQKTRTRKKVTVKESLKFTSKLRIEQEGNLLKFHLDFELMASLLRKCSFHIHWGICDDCPNPWQDLDVRPKNITKVKTGHYTLSQPLIINQRGDYAATLYAFDKESEEQIWLGSDEDNLHFRIEHDNQDYVHELIEQRNKTLKQTENTLFEHIGSYEQFQHKIKGLKESDCGMELSQILFEGTRNDENLRALLSDYYARAIDKTKSPEQVSPVSDPFCLSKTLDNIGVGEVVLVSPEGPHAMAGGLAQVMKGLLESFSKNDIPVTLISPIYEYEQGYKHPCAEDLLQDGIYINGSHLEFNRAGEVDIPLGPTYAFGTTNWVQGAHNMKAAVYVAKKDNMRIMLLRHSRYADRLYPTLTADEHLRRAIFLSRGAIEILKNPLFDIHPHLVISNDWLSALVPVFMKLDLRYSTHENLCDARTIHVIHNCGRNYHGMLSVFHDGQNLWPMLELDYKHYDGIRDPHNYQVLNLTAAAIFHLNGAVVAVSKPYAQQLLTWDGGEGLHHILEGKRDAVFGISNGIDQGSLRQSIIKIGEKAHNKFNGTCPIAEENKAPFSANIVQYKKAAKRLIQEHMGLEQNEHKTIISLVGRLAEQKGIQLLSGFGEGDGVNVMESILCRYPDVQFVVAGPPVDKDDISNQFRGMVEHLARHYPGRVAGAFDFVHHDFALEIFAASDFYLMPSRYEPGGITQLEALASGTIVIARNVGGISATLEQIYPEQGSGNSFLFDEFSSTALRNTICYALDVTHNLEERKKYARNAAQAEHDWSDRIPQYLAVFQYLSGVLCEDNDYEHLRDRLAVVESLKA